MVCGRSLLIYLFKVEWEFKFQKLSQGNFRKLSSMILSGSWIYLCLHVQIMCHLMMGNLNIIDRRRAPAGWGPPNEPKQTQFQESLFPLGHCAISTHMPCQLLAAWHWSISDSCHMGWYRHATLTLTWVVLCIAQTQA